MLSSTALLLTLAFLPFLSSAYPSASLVEDLSQTSGVFSVPITFTLGANPKYVATFAVGTQETEMTVVMDLGSSQSWLYGPNHIRWGNVSLGGPFNCDFEFTPHYSPNDSTTAILNPLNWQTSYGGNGKIVYAQYEAIDTLSLDGSGSGPRLPFIVASQMNVRQHDSGTCLASDAPFDYAGIFGLSGSQNTSGIYGVHNSSFRYNVQHPPAPQTPLIDSATMSVFMRNASTTPALQEMHGEVLLGGIDTSAFVGPLTSIANASSESSTGYVVPYPTLSVAGVNVTLDPRYSTFGGCLLDSGSHVDVWPISTYDDQYHYTPQAFVAQSGLLDVTSPEGYSIWAYPSACSQIPANATFDFTWNSPSGKDITVKVPIRNYARGTLDAGEGKCSLNLDIIGCVLGAPFLSGAYLAVDDDIGVVALAQAGEGSGGRVAIGSGEGIPGLIV